MHPLTYVVILLAVVLLSIQLAQSLATNGSFLYANKTFKLGARVTAINEGRKRVINLEEYYSGEQARAKIRHVRAEGRRTFGGNLYYDRKTEMRVSTTDGLEFSCDHATPKDLNRLLYGDESLEQMTGLLERVVDSPESRHIVGSTRLLILLAQQADRAKLLNSGGKVGLPVKVRNHRAVHYSLSLDGLEQVAGVEAFYEDTGDTRSHLTDSIPLMVSISLGINNDFVTIDFFEPKILQDDWISSEYAHNLYESTNDEVKLEPFSFPVARKCLERVEESKPVKLFGDSPVDAIAFSFTAHTWSESKQWRHFVAFDGLNALLRVDSHRVLRPISKSALVHDRTKITDLRSNRRYIVDLADHLAELKSKLSNLDEQRDVNRCIITYEAAPSKTGRHVYFNLSEYLLGAELFRYLGRARVRGINANVFEGPVSQLPGWFANAMVFKSGADEYQVLKRGMKIDSQGQVSDGRPMTAVVYVADQTGISEATQLLQLDVFYSDHNTDAEYRRVLSVSMVNFIWSLAVAPNGDSVDDLFRLGEVCQSEADSYHEVQLLLKANIDPSAESRLFWLTRNPRPRNEALKTGILDTLDIQSTGLSDLESRVVSTSNQFAIAASFTLHLHHQFVTTIQFLSRAQFIGRHDQVEFIPANSLVDCLWILGQSPKNARIAYAERLGICYVEVDTLKHEFSGIFKMAELGDISIYLVTNYPDTSSTLAQSWLSDAKFQHLEGRVMILQDTSDLKSIDSVGLKMHINKVKMNRLNRQLSKDTDEFTRLAGLSLPETSEYTTLVGHSAGGDGGKVESSPMTLGQCEAACLADLTCKSFSYCSRPTASKCITSKLDVASGEVMGQVKKMNIRQLGQGARVEVTAERNRVKLSRDASCEIHGKNYLSLFQQPEQTQSTLVQKSVHPVASANECAELCFAQSLASIEASVSLHEKVESILGDKSQVGEQLKSTVRSLLDEHRRAMSRFCKTFMHLSSAMSNHQLVAVKQQLNSTAAEARSYCILDGDQAAGRSSKVADFWTVTFDVQFYAFDFESLYEKQSGFKLFGSPVGDDEFDAFQAVSRGDSISVEQHEILKRSMGKRDNFVMTRMTNANNCARDCFLHTWGIWPACKSFDMIVNNYLVEQSASSCQMNTESLESSENVQDENKASTRIKLVHYEPRFEFVKRIMDSDYKMDEFIWGQDAEADVFLGTFSTLTIAFLGLASGLFVGSNCLAPKLSQSTGDGQTEVEDLMPIDAISNRASIDSNKSYVRFEEDNITYPVE